MSNHNGRDLFLDSVAGLLIIHMIAGHCCQWAHMNDLYDKYTSWLFFFMPWFFYKAGMFHRPRPFQEELRKSFRRLIIPYIVFTIVGQLVLWLNLIIHQSFTIRTVLGPIKGIIIEGSASGNLALWFLLSLFCVKLMFNYIESLKLPKFLMGGGNSLSISSLVCAILV